MIIRTLAATMLMTASAAYAVPYMLPSTDDMPHAQLQPEGGGSMLCATWMDDGACDVEPGNYRLVTYTATWEGTSEQIVIGGDSDLPLLSSASATCDVSEGYPIDGVEDENRFLTCQASCPAGTTAIATECSYFSISESTAVVKIASGGECIWRDPDAQIFNAYATCARSDAFD